MIPTTTIINFATSTQVISAITTIWLAEAVMQGMILGMFIGLLCRATWWIWK